ncbi:MAG: hypothetical protein OHK0022_45420 [Roseiflexaceae bacterium]
MTDNALPTELLAQRCVEETEKFNRRQASDSRFCFELLRRALAEGAAEALTRVYQIYERQVLGWVYRHPGYLRTGEDAEYFAGAALTAFYFALRGPNFARFEALPKALAYLKLCVHTAIAQYLRDQRPESAAPFAEGEEPSSLPDLGAGAEAAELWDYIQRLLPDPRDQALARYAFIQDLKPRQILAAAPDQWANEREITLALYRIRRILRNDSDLRDRAGF